MSSEAYLNGRVTLYAGDCLDKIADLADASIDSVVTDPPYGLAFMGRHWDVSGPDQRAFAPAFWAEVHRVLKPGGHVLAFGGTRTVHRLTCAIEDAGFEIRDMVAWLYGSGFPKSHDVSKGIDKAALSIPLFEAIREHIRHWRDISGFDNKALNRAVGSATNGCGMARHWTSSEGGQHSIPSKEQWRRLKTALGWPDCELDAIYDAVKDGAERPIIGHHENASAAAMWRANYQGGTSGTARAVTVSATEAARQWEGWGTALKPALEPITVARKPLDGTVAANVLAHGTGALNIAGCRVGTTKDVPASPRRAAQGSAYGDLSKDPGTGIGWDANTGRWPANLIHDGSDEVVAAFPDRKTTWVSEKHANNRDGDFLGALKHPGSQGFNDEGSAARFFYNAKADANDRIASKHPTVKPVDLLRYLVRLVTPPGGTVLDPFAGTGTTGEAAYYEGFNAVLIEREDEYRADIARRMALVMSGPDERKREITKAKAVGKAEDLTGTLFAFASVAAE